MWYDKKLPFVIMFFNYCFITGLRSLIFLDMLLMRNHKDITTTVY